MGPARRRQRFSGCNSLCAERRDRRQRPEAGVINHRSLRQLFDPVQHGQDLILGELQPQLLQSVRDGAAAAVTSEDQLDLWLIEGAERFKRDPEISRVLLRVARHDDSRKCLKLLGEIIETPGLMDRLLQVLEPQRNGKGPHHVS